MITKLMQEIKERLEIIDEYLQRENYLVTYEKSLEYMKKEIDDRNEHIKEQQARIDKAIEYIMTNHCLHLLDKSIINSKELLDILKGSDSNDTMG